ncbi:N-acetylmuramoyl-L-alanine amidase family protein [Paenibacillus sp. GP183]|uniref:N-acetylmuramoyl-L-alanine amidase family protein n=1 Tax=Paenibacillus sp. GP183 TaxID=1882751 RepID=UPI0008968BD2|nr:N-acetylmuramoyl-L-alanine amidase family protein [Paenibacillus sp. GP183]SEB62405.1 N-acetylmuramoyl-L-alanine amidase [Paenibacillus sp. GP183]
MKLPAVLLALFVCTLILPSMVWGADVPIKLYMNEKLLQPEVAPRLVAGNTLVPLKIVAEELGAKVKWDEAKRQVSIDKGDTSIQLTIDKPNILVSGKSKMLEVAPIIVEGSSMLPLRVIGEQFGVQFNWDGLTSSVHMFKKESAAPTDSIPDKPPIPENQPASPKPSPVGPTASPTPVPVKNGPQIEPVIPPAESPAIPANQPVKLVESIETSGTGIIVRSKDGILKPTMLKLENPDRIVFDLPYSALGDNLTKKLTGTQGELPSNHPLIQKIRFSNYNSVPSTVRIILDLKEKADFEILPSLDPSIMLAAIKKHTIKVVIDAGHGAKDPGAISITGKQEKDFNLSMANKLNMLLSADKRIEVLMTRNDDTFVELDDRAKFANEHQVDLFLSIHGNKYVPKISGVETYYSRTDSIALANLIHKNTVAATGFPDRGVRQADFRVIAKTTMPAVLVEVGYLSNQSDEASMFKDAFQNQVAASLASAIKEYLNLK